jgi:hypothetical protein
LPFLREEEAAGVESAAAGAAAADAGAGAGAGVVGAEEIGSAMLKSCRHAARIFFFFSIDPQRGSLFIILAPVHSPAGMKYMQAYIQ